MPTYEVTITESWSGTVTVDAADMAEAEELALDIVQTEYDETVDVYITEVKPVCKHQRRRNRNAQNR